MTSITHLRDLLESLDNETLRIDNSLSVTDEDYILTTLRKNAEHAMCFHIGDPSQMGPLVRPEIFAQELVRLPYPFIWAETTFTANDGAPCRMGGFVYKPTELESGFMALCFTKFVNGGEWHANGWGGLTFIDGKLNTVTHAHKDLYLSIRGFYGLIAVFLAALNCKNVQCVQTQSYERLNRARQKRGKKPLFSTWTLNLFLPTNKSERANHGGTHASPRVHLRRGHPRQFAPGKWAWVQPHVVGRGPGIVHKDYAATYAP